MRKISEMQQQSPSLISSKSSKVKQLVQDQHTGVQLAHHVSDYLSQLPEGKSSKSSLWMNTDENYVRLLLYFKKPSTSLKCDES